MVFRSPPHRAGGCDSLGGGLKLLEGRGGASQNHRVRSTTLKCKVLAFQVMPRTRGRLPPPQPPVFPIFTDFPHQGNLVYTGRILASSTHSAADFPGSSILEGLSKSRPLPLPVPPQHFISDFFHILSFNNLARQLGLFYLSICDVLIYLNKKIYLLHCCLPWQDCSRNACICNQDIYVDKLTSTYVFTHLRVIHRENCLTR